MYPLQKWFSQQAHILLRTKTYVLERTCLYLNKAKGCYHCSPSNGLPLSNCLVCPTLTSRVNVCVLINSLLPTFIKRLTVSKTHLNALYKLNCVVLTRNMVPSTTGVHVTSKAKGNMLHSGFISSIQIS